MRRLRRTFPLLRPEQAPRAEGGEPHASAPMSWYFDERRVDAEIPHLLRGHCKQAGRLNYQAMVNVLDGHGVK